MRFFLMFVRSFFLQDVFVIFIFRAFSFFVIFIFVIFRDFVFSSTVEVWLFMFFFLRNLFS